MKPHSERYVKLIDATLRAAFAVPRSVESAPETLHVAVALPAAARRLAMTAERSVSLSPEYGGEGIAEASGSERRGVFVDGAGHQRPMYRCIALRTLALDPISRPRVTPLLETFTIDVAEPLERFAGGDTPIRASNGVAVVGAIFAAWATLAMTPDARRSRQCLDRLVAQQQPDGTFLSRTASDNPEPRWYDELSLLHALSTTGIAEHREAVARAARYHAAETQPDHASAHPWAVAAFLEEPDGVQLADLMLHAAGVQQPATMDAVSLLLLADALERAR